ncbi:MAG: hypothetical protein JXA69_01850 [Phycisphaerae bacterium]|nr:hypothetical protein [Phycisphaerae bacterium]
MLAEFTGYDWGIVIVLVLIASMPGYLVRKYIKQQADFLIAGRTLSVYLATATLTATEMGLITVMYFSQQGFLNGFSAFTIGVIAAVTTLFVGLTGFMVSGLRASGVTTFAEYYQQRYGPGVRVLGGLILATAGILNYGIFLRTEADFVRFITGTPEVVTLAGMNLPALELVMTVLVIIVLTYTLLGGMVSIVITDYIQFIILTVGLGVTTYYILMDPTVGGMAGIASAVETHRPGYGMNPFILKKEGTTLLGLGGLFVAWQVMHWTATSCWQTQAFRTAAVDSPRTARIMWSFTGINYFGRALIPMLWGAAALAYFATTGGLGEVKDIEAMPRFVAAILPSGISGLLLAGMLAALMSTHSGYLLAWSGVLTEDLLAPVCRAFGYTLPDRTRLWITRGFIVLLGAYLLVFGLWYEVKSSLWNFLAVTGTMYFAGAATLLAFGLYWKRANIGGAFAGLIAGGAPGVLYLVMHITTLIVEPEITQVGHVPVHAVAVFSAKLTENWIGLISYPLGILGMVIGSLVYASLRGGGGSPSMTAGAKPEVQS